MKQRLVIASSFLCSSILLNAANIGWVSFHSGDNEPSVNAAAAGFTQAPDAGYTTLLASKGHNVTRFVSVEDLDLNPDLIAALNTNDLVIISRSVPSSHYELATETAAWNGIAKPTMVLGGYITRNIRLGFTTGGTVVDVNSQEVRLRVNSPNHPIFSGVSLDANGLMVNPFAQRVTYTNTSGATTLQNGISVNNNTLPAGGANLAVVGTAGDAAVNGMVISEFPQGTTLNARDVLAANRLVFLTGSREASVTSEAAGIYDLLTDGEKLFLNAVSYLTVPFAPIITQPLASGSNLVEGDRWTFDAGVMGSAPLTYQWYKNGQPIGSATEALLAINSLVLSDAGQYHLVAANDIGRATSSVATLEFATFPAPDITNAIISYWPLDNVAGGFGGKTPDLVSGYDMTLENMGPTNVVPGKFANAFFFTNESHSLLYRIHNPGDDLPMYSKSNFTVSLWVQGPVQSDHRIFSEGSSLQNNTLFNLGTHNSGADGSVDIYVRSDSGALNLDHVHSTAIAFDDTWHHIAYVQRDVGGGQMRALLYVDGVQDPAVIAPIRPLTPTSTSIGGILRASPSAWYTGLIDEVAVWERALSPAEIQILQTTAITNAPSRVQPLIINAFRGDLPAVRKGGSTTLRWDTSSDVTQVVIEPGIGDVTSKTSGGVGSQAITIDESTSYTLTAKRGSDTLTATTAIAVVDGVAAGWTLLDNFDTYSPGSVAQVKYWTDARGDSAQFIDYSGNTALKNTTGDSIAYLNLGDLALQEGQSGTLFFRLITGTNTATGITNIVGLTDKVQRGYGDEYFNIGPVVYASALTNDVFGIDTNAWYLGARNGFIGENNSPAVDFPGQPLQAATVYNVWLDVTNAPMDQYMSDTFSVYVQEEGDSQRLLLFQDYVSDRDFFFVEPVLGGMRPTLDKLVVLGNNATLSAVFDDFYLSKGAYNATVPRAYGFTGVIGQLPALQVEWSGDRLELKWTSGTLQESSSLTEWSDVSGANPPSHLVDPSSASKFYRARR